MRTPQWRGAIEQRRDCLPCGEFVGELVRFSGNAEAVAGFQCHSESVPGEGVDRFAAVGVHIDTRKALADELVSDHLARGINCRARSVNRGRAFGVPARALLAHVLYAY